MEAPTPASSTEAPLARPLTRSETWQVWRTVRANSFQFLPDLDLADRLDCRQYNSSLGCSLPRSHGSIAMQTVRQAQEIRL